MHAPIHLHLDRIDKTLAVKFDVRLFQEQLLALIERQTEELKTSLQEEKITLATLNQLVEAISEEITGIHYPTEHSTTYYKEYFKKKLQENKGKYFDFML